MLSRHSINTRSLSSSDFSNSYFVFLSDGVGPQNVAGPEVTYPPYALSRQAWVRSDRQLSCRLRTEEIGVAENYKFSLKFAPKLDDFQPQLVCLWTKIF